MKNRRELAFRLGLSVLPFLLLVLKAPHLLMDPRFSAEEGSIFFQRVHIGLPLFHPHWLEVGYFDPVPILGALWAVYGFTIENAPLATTVLALFVHALPAVMIAWSPSSLFSHPLRRILGILAVVIAVPVDPIWLSTLSSKFYLALVPVILVLNHLERDRMTRPRFLSTLSMLLAPLSGGAAPLLAPAVAFLMWRPGGPRFRILGTAFLIGCVLQASCVLGSARPGSGDFAGSERLKFRDPITVISSATLHSFLPLVLGPIADVHGVNQLLRGSLPDSVDVTRRILASLLPVAILLGFSRGPRSLWLTSGIVLLLYGSSLFSLQVNDLSPDFHLPSRYWIAPMIAVCLLLLSNLQRRVGNQSPIRIWVASALLGVILVTGAHRYLTVEVLTASPSWRTEVAKFRSDRGYAIPLPPPPFCVYLLDDDSRVPSLIVSAVIGASVSLTVEPKLPKLGQVVSLTIAGAPALARGILHIQIGCVVPPKSHELSPEPLVILPLPLDAGVLIPFETEASGTWNFRHLLGDTAHVAGIPYTIQAIVTTPRFEVTNGVTLRLGY